MDVLGYEDVGGYAEALLFAGLFEDLLYGVFCGGSLEEGLPFVTTEGDDVELVGLLETFEARWHGGASSLHPTLRRSAKDGAPGILWLAESGKGVDLVGLAVYIPPFAKARRMGHPGFCGWLIVERRDLVGLAVYIPPFAKGAKDGAPGVLWLVESGKARTWWGWRFTSHPSQKREG